MENKAIDPVTLEVIWNRFMSVANEQQDTLIRTAFSTIVRVASRTSTVTVSDPEKVSVLASGRTLISYSTGTTLRGNCPEDVAAASAGADTDSDSRAATASFMKQNPLFGVWCVSYAIRSGFQRVVAGQHRLVPPRFAA